MKKFHIFIIIAFILLIIIFNYKEGMLELNHAVDVSGILQDKIPSSTKIAMISKIGINEPEDPLFYNILIDNGIEYDHKVKLLNEKIEKYFNPPKENI